MTVTYSRYRVLSERNNDVTTYVTSGFGQSMTVTREDKLQQLERLLHALHGSENLRAFLRFVALKAIDDQEGQIKEYVIALEVFGRSSNYDPRVDSAVRVQAGRLRAKLHDYYATEGQHDRVYVELPKGHYTPVFSYKHEAIKQARPNSNDEATVLIANGNTSPASVGSTPSADPATLEVVNAPVNSDAAPAQRSGQTTVSSKRWQMATLALALLAILLGVLVFFYRARAFAVPAWVVGGGAGESEALKRSEVEPLWGELLRSSEPVLVVYSNTLFEGTTEEGMRLLKPLDAPGSSLGSPVMPQSEIEGRKQPVIEHYTGIGEVMGAYFLGDFFARVQHSARVKRSLLLNWEDLKTENIVVIGSPAENFFLRDLPQKQDFLFKPNLPDAADGGKKSFGVLNTKPQPGEQQYYLARQEGPSRSQISEDYAVVSLLGGLSAKNRLLILAGITTLGTQAAVEYVTRPGYIKDLIAHLNTAAPGAPPQLPAYYQVLVKVKVNGGVPVQISYVTHHVLSQ